MYGKVLESGGRPVPDTLVEIWQANAGGRYRHDGDQHPSPLDPYFTGLGRCVTDREGNYKFITIQPGAYPWGNHPNAWRPAHIHFSLFGRSFTQRLVTQMYFPGDPLFPFDPIFNSVRDPKARERMIAQLRPRHDGPRLGARATSGTSCCAAPTRPPRTSTDGRAHPDAVADRRPVLRDRPPLVRRPGRRAARHARRLLDPRHRVRRQRRADPGRARRDLAGGSRTGASTTRRPARRRRRLPRLRPLGRRRRGPATGVRTVKPGSRALQRRPRCRRRTSP